MRFSERGEPSEVRVFIMLLARAASLPKLDYGGKWIKERDENPTNNLLHTQT